MAESPVVDGEVAPTLTDPAIAAGSDGLGGPAGAHRLGGGFWTPLRVILLTGTAVFWLGFLRTYPCWSNGWLDPDRYEHLCYSDIPVLYQLRGLADGFIPYLEWPTTDQPLEYPVLIGLLLLVTARVTAVLAGGADPLTYYVVTAVALFACYLVALIATSLTVKGRIWDGLMLALSPAVFLASFVNWDWPVVALTAGFFLLWSRSRPGWAGVALGLAVAAKFYPVLILGPLFLLCLRAGRLRAWGLCCVTAAVAWLVVNVPVWWAAPEGWSYFFTFSADRGQDFGSPWLVLQTMGRGVDPLSLNSLVTGSLILLCAGVAALILFARRRPRLAQVAFLVAAAFLLTNKVYSPQYVLWLLPLAILARPRWRDIVWWQVAEGVYFVAVWWYLVGFTDGAKGLSEQWYAAATALHIVATLVLAGLVVRDILWPRFDPVRADGAPTHTDDPGGGVLDHAPDWRRPPSGSRTPPTPSAVE